MKNKYWLIGIFAIVLMSNIYAASVCWKEITCEYSGPITSGAIIAIDYNRLNSKKEEYCIINELNVNFSSSELLEIVIHQGQYQGGDSDIKRILVDQEFASTVPLVFKLSKDTSPTTIICNEVIPATTPGQGYEVIKSLNYWSASYDQQWYTNANGTPEYKREPFGFEGTTKIDLVDTNISKTYTNYPATMGGDWLVFALAIFLFLIGLLIIFQTVIEYYKRK